jgi:hypothetical protein
VVTGRRPPGESVCPISARFSCHPEFHVPEKHLFKGRRGESNRFGLGRNSLFGVPAPERIPPFVSNRALFGALSLSEMVGTTLSCLPPVLNTRNGRVFNRFSQTPLLPGTPESTFLLHSPGYPVGTGSYSRSLKINLQGSIERQLKRLVLFLTTGCGPPERLHRVRTRINTDEGERPKIHRRSSNWKPGLLWIPCLKSFRSPRGSF